MATLLTSSRYAMAPDVRLCMLDEEAVIFNPFSWETHLLNCAAALVLDMAASGYCTEAAVGELLSEVLDEQERPRAAEHAKELLQQLLALRLLVEQSPEYDARR